MFRYLLLLAAAMFATLLVAGRDQGQLRFGLTGAYAPPPPVPIVARQVTATGAEPLVLAAFDPEDATAPVTVPAEPAAAPEAVAEAPAAAPEAAAAQPDTRIMWVKSNTINLREGPSTGTAVLGRLSRNEAVVVVAEAPDGWLRVRLEGDGGEGFVAARLLTDVDPAN